MFTGQPPMLETETKDMLAKMLKRSFGAIKPLGDLRYAPDEHVSQVVEKMMKIELKARYQTMDQVVHDLEAYEARMKSPETVAAYVLGRFREPNAEVNELIGRAADAVQAVVSGSWTP